MVSLATAVAAFFLQGASHVHRVVIEVNTPGTAAYDLVLGNATNVRKALAPDRTEVEIVCHGPGIALLLAKGRVGLRVAALARSGVTFVACANTLRGRKISPKALPPFVHVAPSGVGEVIRRQEAGWTYLKGGY